MEKIVRSIHQANKIAIFAHVLADCDCLGSAVALKNALEKLDKQVTIFVGDDSYENTFDFLIESTSFLKPLNSDDFDLFIALDVADAGMLGIYKNQFLNHNNSICIDHHLSNKKYAKYTYLKVSPSCCEIIFDLIKKLHVQIDKKIATYLYAGIISDTVCLSVDTINEHTFKILYELFKTGFDFSYVLDKIYRIKSIKHIRIQSYICGNFKNDCGVAYLIIKSKDYKKIGIKSSEFSCADFVNYILNVEGIKFAILVGQIEKNNYKVSLRCQRGYDVNIVASELNGGGHKQAAGARFSGNPNETIKKLVDLCKKQMN